MRPTARFSTDGGSPNPRTWAEVKKKKSFAPVAMPRITVTKSPSTASPAALFLGGRDNPVASASPRSRITASMPLPVRLPGRIAHRGSSGDSAAVHTAHATSGFGGSRRISTTTALVSTLGKGAAWGENVTNPSRRKRPVIHRHRLPAKTPSKRSAGTMKASRPPGASRSSARNKK